MDKIHDLINIEFSYNGNLGELQQRTIDNKVFAGRLLQNGIISREEWRECIKEISDYFKQEINKAAENPLDYISRQDGNTMKLTKLIAMLQETLELNGDMTVVGMRSGFIYPDIELNCPDSESPLYIELYNPETDEENFYHGIS